MDILDMMFGKPGAKTAKESVAESSRDQQLNKQKTTIEKNQVITKQSNKQSPVIEKGYVTTTKIDITDDNFERIMSSFVAFDTETTGLSADRDVIIEVGAVKFVDGEMHSSYGTLIDEGKPVPPAASSVNHITTAMLRKDGKKPEVAYPELMDFWGDILSGEVYICAHNASFDMRFLERTLERLGYSGNIKYLDTLTLSRKYVKGLVNYKQDTVAAHFGLKNSNSHRAESDAQTCGQIMANILKIRKEL